MKKILTYSLFLGLCFSALSQVPPKIGDLITNPDGSKGVVFWITPDQSKGFMVALDDIAPSYTFRYGVETLIPEIPQMKGNDTIMANWQAREDLDGYTNTLWLKAYSDCHPDSAHMACLVDLDNGWFIPSLGLLFLLRANNSFINQEFVRHGGTPLATSTPILSSTQHCADSIWVFWQGRVQTRSKTSIGAARAVREFAMPPKMQMVADTTLDYRWHNGDTITKFFAKPTTDSIFSVTATSSVGCATTAHKQVFVSTTEERILYDTICIGYAYRRNGFELPADSNLIAGNFTYSKTLSNDDCDVNITLHLTKKPTQETAIVDSFCNGNSYIHNGVIYESAGEYVQFLTSENGCDSILHLTLSLKYGVTTMLSEQSCGFYVWNNQYYYTSGIYSQTFVATNGCDSIVNKKIEISKNSQGWLELHSCQQATYNGVVYFRDTTFSDPLTNSAHCDSLLIVNITINSHFDTIHLYGTDSVLHLQNAYYQDTILIFHHQNSKNCDSILHVHIFVERSPIEPPVIDTEIHVYWGRVLAVPNPRGLDELRLATYYWYHNDILLPQSEKSWIEIGNPIPVGTYNVSVHYGGSELLYLERIFDSPFGVIAYPNPMNTTDELTIQTNEKTIKRIEIFDGNGTLQNVPIRKNNMVSGFKKSGTYFIRIHLDDNSVDTLKIVVK